MDLYWIWLTLIKGLGPVTQKILLSHFQTPENIYHSSTLELINIPKLNKNLNAEIKDPNYLEKAKIIWAQTQKLDIKLLKMNSPEYPPHLKEIRDFPLLLYYRSSSGLKSGGVGIVGSRRCTDYGKRVATEAAEFLAHHQVPVISGLAKGIDGYAHTACLKAGGYTIAFVAHGLDICYPSEQRSLRDAIIENGAVISEYPPGVRPSRNYFPRRNHLISAWLDKLLVVEAAKNSGTLITAHRARELGKEVYAVPNNIYQTESKGTNRLIQEGAKIYLEKDQLLPSGLDSPSLEQETDPKENILPRPKKVPLEGTAEKIYQALETPKRPEELLPLAEGEFSKLTAILSSLELQGYIQILPGNLISRCP